MPPIRAKLNYLKDAVFRGITLRELGVKVMGNALKVVASFLTIGVCALFFMVPVTSECWSFPPGDSGSYLSSPPAITWKQPRDRLTPLERAAVAYVRQSMADPRGYDRAHRKWQRHEDYYYSDQGPGGRALLSWVKRQSIYRGQRVSYERPPKPKTYKPFP